MTLTKMDIWTSLFGAMSIPQQMLLSIIA